MRKIIMSVIIIVLIASVAIGLVGCAVPSVESAFKSIYKSENYQFTAYAFLPGASIIAYVKNAGKLRYVDTGGVKFVLDYNIGNSEVGIYASQSNVWGYDEKKVGDEGTGIGANIALRAFNLASDNFADNFTYNKETKRYELNKDSYYKIYAETYGGKCEIYKSRGKIFIECYHGLDFNNKERIIIEKVGGVRVKIPKVTELEMDENKGNDYYKP